MEIQSKADYQEKLSKSTNSFVFYFRNDCQELIDKFNNLSKNYEHFNFFLVDLNKVENPELKVSPTVKYFLNGEEKDSYSGKSVDKLNLFIVKFFVQKVNTHDEFKYYINNYNGLVVVDFTATWCGPCKKITPMYNQLNSEYNKALFLKIDVDDNEETTSELNITAMPTFQFYKSGKKVEQFSGADPKKLSQSIVNNY